MSIFKVKYAELMKLTKDAAREAMAPHRAREMQTQAAAKIAQLESKIAEAEQKVVELGSAYPIDFDKLVAAMDDAALMKRRREQLQTIVAELFPPSEG